MGRGRREGGPDEPHSLFTLAPVAGVTATASRALGRFPAPPRRCTLPTMNVAALTTSLAAAGLNAAGVADPRRWDAQVGPERRSDVLLPGARAILVFGSGGGRLWDALLADLRASPSHLAEEPHPLDAFVRRTVAAADPLLGSVRRRWFFAAADADLHLDFRALADLAGLGGRSRLGLLLSPEFGLWLGLRAACFVDAALPFSAAPNPDPCAGCPAPCISACPGNAFVDGQWSVDRCSAFHAESTACIDSCAARSACPRAPDARYSADEVLYHYDRASGRAMLRERVGLAEPADRFEGVGPHWNEWRRKVNVHGGA